MAKWKDTDLVEPSRNLYMDENPKEPFFNRQFWRMTLIAAFSQMIVLLIALTASMIFGGKLDKVIALSDSLNQTMITFTQTVETALGVDPIALQEKADGLRDRATDVRVGVGDGGGEVVDRIGDALDRWKDKRDNNNEGPGNE